MRESGELWLQPGWHGAVCVRARALFLHVFVCHVSFDSAVKETAVSPSLGGRMLSG